MVTLPANRKAVWRSEASRSNGSSADVASRGMTTSYQRRAALAAGSPAAELFKVHVDALLALVHRPRGEVQLPGRLTVSRDGDRLLFRRTSSGVAG